MKSLISLLTIGVLGVMVFGVTEYEDENAFMVRSLLIGCRKPTDVIFLLDASSSIWGPDFRKHLDFVRTVIRDLGIDSSMVRCGLVTYGDQVRVEFGLRTYSSGETATKAVSLVRQLRGSTRTDLALRRMREMMAEDKRSGVPQIGIVLTDGESDYPAATRNESEMAHQEGIALFAVGFGEEVDLRELRAIASQEEFVFLLNNQKELEILKGFLWKTICSYSEEQQDEEKDDFQPLPECQGVPLDLTFLLDHSIAFFPENLQRSQRFVQDSLSLLSVSKDETHASVITFGDLARLQFDLDAYSNLTDIRIALSRIGLRNSETDIAKALSILGSSTEKTYRKESTKVAVIVTAGRVGEPLSAAVEAARLKEKNGVVIFVVGVGAGVDREELESMASYRSDQTYFHTRSYENLESITLKLIKTVCGITQHTKQPPATKTGIGSTNIFTITATGVPIPSITTAQSSPFTKTSKSDLETSAASATETAVVPPRIKTSEATPVTPSTTSYRVPASATPPKRTPTDQNIPTFTSAPDIWTKWTSPTPRQPRTPPNMPCSSLRPADIVFALPSSLGEADTSHALEFIAVLGDQMGLDGKAVRVGVTPRLCPPHVRDITLDQGSSNYQLKKALNDRRLNVNHSDILSLLIHLNEVSFGYEQMAGRGDAVKIAVLFFDPKVVVSEEVIQEVNGLIWNSVVLVGVSVGEGDDGSSGRELLASCHNCLLHAKSYADLDGSLSDRLATIVMDRRCLREVPPNF